MCAAAAHLRTHGRTNAPRWERGHAYTGIDSAGYLALDVPRLEARQHCLFHDRDALLSIRLDREAGRIKAAQLHDSYRYLRCVYFHSFITS